MARESLNPASWRRETAFDPHTGYSIDYYEDADGRISYSLLGGGLVRSVVTSREELVRGWHKGLFGGDWRTAATRYVAFELLRRFINEYTVPCDTEELTLP